MIEPVMTSMAQAWSTLEHSLGGSLETIGWAVVHSLWIGALCALGYLLTRAATANPAIRYRVAILALATTVGAPVLTAWSLDSPRAGTTISLVGTENQSSTSGDATGGGKGQAVPSRLPAPSSMIPRLGELWLIGTLLFSLRLASAAAAARSLVHRGTSPAASALQRRVAQLAAELAISRRVRVLVSKRLDVPCVVGLLRPTLVVPLSLMTGIAPQHLESLLWHELAHVRRHDCLVSLLQGIATTLLFYHPLVHWLSREIRAERELCCDELAASRVGSRTDYATALAQLERLRVAAPPAPTMAASGGDLRRRIQRLIGPAEPRPTAAGVVGILSATAILVLAATVSVPLSALPAARQPTQQTTAEPPVVVLDLRVYEMPRAALVALELDWQVLPGARLAYAAPEPVRRQLLDLGATVLAGPRLVTPSGQTASLSAASPSQGSDPPTASLRIEVRPRVEGGDSVALSLLDLAVSGDQDTGVHFRLVDRIRLAPDQTAVVLPTGSAATAVVTTVAARRADAREERIHRAAKRLRSDAESVAAGPWQGAPVTLSLQGADLEEVVKAFATQFDLEIAWDGVSEAERRQAVDEELVDIPWDFALQHMLNQHCLALSHQGNTVTISHGPQTGPRAGDPVPCSAPE